MTTDPADPTAAAKRARDYLNARGKRPGDIIDSRATGPGVRYPLLASDLSVLLAERDSLYLELTIALTRTDASEETP